jgi:CheY-like chemotaxis protein
VARRGVEEVHKAGVCATLLTRQLLAFSRREMVTPQVLDLCAVVGEMEGMLTRLIGEDVHLVTRLEGGPAWVKADRSQMEQVILNLAVNARDAMPDGGTLEIRVTNAAPGAARRDGATDKAPDGTVTLSLTDTGCGMDPETRSRVFEPFFTTKTRERGTGLGLSLVHGIVQASAGRIEVDSEPGRGTTIRIHLPRERVGALAERARADLVAPGGGETVLLVEDEEAVRHLVHVALASAGYTVLEAKNGLEALEVARGHSGTIHLVLTDVVMPHMGGGELVRRLERVRPGTRVLYMSGYNDDTIVRQGILTEGAAFIQKPFALEDLARRVRRVIDSDARDEGRAAA